MEEAAECTGYTHSLLAPSAPLDWKQNKCKENTPVMAERMAHLMTNNL